MALLSQDEIKNALTRLGEVAQAHGLQVELVAVGGAVMVLAYGTRLATHDVDVFVLSPKEARNLVPGHELKAQYAFLDLWEETYGEY